MNLSNLRKYIEERAISKMTPEEINEVFNTLNRQAIDATAHAEQVTDALKEIALQHAAAEPAMVLTTGDKLYAIQPAAAALKEALSDQEELHRMQMVAIQVTAQCNTRQSASEQRCPDPSPYRTLALADVEAAIDREISLREQLLALKVALKPILRDKLDSVTVHPCDEHDDKVKAHAAGPVWENLYNLVNNE